MPTRPNDSIFARTLCTNFKLLEFCFKRRFMAIRCIVVERKNGEKRIKALKITKKSRQANEDFEREETRSKERLSVNLSESPERRGTGGHNFSCTSEMEEKGLHSVPKPAGAKSCII